MALNNLGLGFLFTARDLASGVMGRVQGQFNKTASTATKQSAVMGAAFGQTALGLGLVSVGVGTLAASFAAANQFAAFEQGLAAVKSVTKATTEEMELLKETAVQAGIDTQFSPDEATEGLLSLASAGQTATQATRTLIPVLDLAAGSLGQLGVAQSAEAVVGTLNAYGFAADRAGNVTDRLLRITQLTNFQTRDFETGLAKAAAAGSTFNQGLDDVLITMGLLRNRNIDASSSATAFREATRRLGSDQRAQQAITGEGVDIFDKNTKKMRSVIDITSDLIEATNGMTDEERNRVIVQGFGARGLLAFNAIQKASFTTLRDGKQVTLEGAEAIEAMRGAMGEATGTAESFRKELLDTFEGQKTLFAGTMQTLGIVSGEAFAKTFKPVVAAVTDALNKLIVLIKETPTPVKQLIAGVVVLFGAFASGAGMLTLFGAAVFLLMPALKIIAITFLVVLAALLPVMAAVGALTGLIYGFKVAIEELPGPFSKGNFLLEKFRLGFEALKQIFSQGGFSGEVRKELGERGNAGLRNFVISVFLFVNRIKNFFSGLRDGFKEAIRGMGPTFTSLFESFRTLGRALGFLGEKADADDAKGKFESWGNAGEKIGRVVATAFEKIVGFITKVNNAISIAIGLWNDLTEPLMTAKSSLGVLGSTFKNVGRDMGLLDTETPAGGARAMGEAFKDVALVVGFVFGVVVAQVSFAVNTVRAILGGLMGVLGGFATFFSGIFDFIGGILTGDWARAWQGAQEILLGWLKGVISIMSAAVETITGSIDAIAGAFGVELNLTEAAIGGRKDLIGDLESALGPPKGAATPASGPTAPVSPSAPRQFVTMSNATGGAMDSPGSAEADMRRKHEMEMERLNRGFAARGSSQEPVVVRSVLMLDGEQIASAVRKAERGKSATSFNPGGTPAEV